MNEQLTEQSVESQNDSTKESINTYEFRSQVREEISSLREKVDQILKALNVKNECDPDVIMEEIHRYPKDRQDFVRCAIIGLIRGDEYSRSGYTIHTTRMDNIFDNPNTTPEKWRRLSANLPTQCELMCVGVCVKAIRLALNSTQSAI